VSVKHLNQRQLADRWGVGEASLERWRSAGIGPVFLKIQGRVLYRVEDVEAYEAACLRTCRSRISVSHSSRRQSFVMVMQATDFWQLNYRSKSRWLHRSRLRTVHLQ
jgi:hypothetical protein